MSHETRWSRDMMSAVESRSGRGDAGMAASPAEWEPSRRAQKPRPVGHRTGHRAAG